MATPYTNLWHSHVTSYSKPLSNNPGLSGSLHPDSPLLFVNPVAYAYSQYFLLFSCHAAIFSRFVSMISRALSLPRR